MRPFVNAPCSGHDSDEGGEARGLASISRMQVNIFKKEYRQKSAKKLKKEYSIQLPKRNDMIRWEFEFFSHTLTWGIQGLYEKDGQS